MKRNGIIILLAAMLLTGCSLRDALPDSMKNKWDKIQAVLNETDEPAETGGTPLFSVSDQASWGRYMDSCRNIFRNLLSSG